MLAIDDVGLVAFDRNQGNVLLQSHHPALENGSIHHRDDQ